MSIALSELFAFAIAYLALLFLIAWSADRGILPAWLVSNPLTYSLSLGVYATSWTYYGSVGLADTSGYAFLTIYLGVTAAFLLGPWLLAPLLRLCRDHQLTSIADLLAFRYGGRRTGFVVTLFMLVGILPYVSLQIRAVTESVQVLSRQVPPALLALGFCVAITGFALLFGARHLGPREKHGGLVLAIAFESAVKLIALLCAGGFALTEVFDSPAAFSAWAGSQPEMIEALYEPASSTLWSTLLLLAFCAAFLLPRQYHMTFVENQNPEHLKTAYWLFPLYLLLLNLPIIPILFAGRHLSLATAPDFYVLGMTLTTGREWLAILVFLGGLSAASAMMIVTTLALSTMCLNHILLPAALGGDDSRELYRRLLWSKRLIIGLIIAAGYAFYIVIELNTGLASLGLISFVAAAQLLPGVLCLLFWSRATQAGFVAGLSGGAMVWFVLLIWPLLAPDTVLLADLRATSDPWSLATFCSLSVNGLLLVFGSLATRPSREESVAAEATTERAELAVPAVELAASPLQYRDAMQRALGRFAAEQELARALAETGTTREETRPARLQLLHDRLERNLTGLLGPTLARRALRPHASLDASGKLSTPLSPDERGLSAVRLAELRLESSASEMRGLTRQLDELRRYLAAVLRELPIGACSIASDGRIYLWNAALSCITGIDERLAQDKPLDELPAPWAELLIDFAASSDDHLLRHRVATPDKPLSINLHKAAIATAWTNDGRTGGLVILIEDRSNLDALESELAHNERLASIGRLAAGVAHEIGNPLTGIASLAQNLRHDAQSLASKADAELGAMVHEQAEEILTQTRRIDSIVRSLLSFSHAGHAGASTGRQAIGDLDRFDIDTCIDEALRLIRLAPRAAHIRFDVHLPSGAAVRGDRNELVQVFVNLLNNACDASPVDGCIRVLADATKTHIRVRILDQGPGMTDATQARLFEPFYTTKPVGEGTGLGLSLVYSIVTHHGGRIRLGQCNPGTEMIVELPKAPVHEP